MTLLSAARASLAIDEIHVWTARLTDDPHASAGLMASLSAAERTRAAQLSFMHDRVRYIQAHGMVRQILGNYLDADPSMLSFARNRHGKPYLLRLGHDPNLEFNLSHSGDCCMLAVRLDRQVGIDVEKVRDLPQAMAIAKSYLNPAETSLLAALSETARRDSFFALWTRKEAMVKALGVGLAAKLSRLEFDLDPAGGGRLVARNGDQSVAPRWFIRRVDPFPGYVATIASARPIQSLRLQNWSHIDGV
jgi:4'-phosphopantetheinyl transferase